MEVNLRLRNKIRETRELEFTEQRTGEDRVVKRKSRRSVRRKSSHIQQRSNQHSLRAGRESHKIKETVLWTHRHLGKRLSLPSRLGELIWAEHSEGSLCISGKQLSFKQMPLCSHLSNIRRKTPRAGQMAQQSRAHIVLEENPHWGLPRITPASGDPTPFYNFCKVLCSCPQNHIQI